MGRWFVAIGLILVTAGLLWPWLGKLGLGRLPGDFVPGDFVPGDFVIERGGFTFYFPIVTCLIVSVALSLIFWFLNR
jgi:hypothetical protein